MAHRLCGYRALVEGFAGICGAKDGIEAMPDGEYLPPFPFNCVEAFMKKKLAEHFPDRKMIQGRWAHLSEPQDIHLQQGRGKCQCRNLCVRGCPYGGYFSSVASTLPWAEKTGNLTIRPFSVVHSLNYDEQAGKATGVKVIDTNTREELEFRASIIFLNASALNTNLILLNSRSARFPNGLGNDNGLLGKYICFHNYRPSAWAVIDGFDAVYVSGRLPSGPIIPNFKNFKKRNADFLGGYMTFIGAMRPARTSVPDDQPQLGIDFKHRLSEPGDWIVYMYMMVTDCYGEEEMTIFRESIGKVQATSRHKYKRGFLKLQTQEKLALLTAFDQEARKNPEGELIHFFTLMKQLTILGYFTSEPGVTQALRYDPIPGGYNGCEEYREGDNAWYGPLSSIG